MTPPPLTAGLKAARRNAIRRLSDQHLSAYAKDAERRCDRLQGQIDNLLDLRRTRSERSRLGTDPRRLVAAREEGDTFKRLLLARQRLLLARFELTAAQDEMRSRENDG